MARPPQSPATTRTRQGIKLPERAGRPKSRGDVQAVLQRGGLLALVVVAVGYITAWRYNQKKALHAGEHAHAHAPTGVDALPPHCVFIDRKATNVHKPEDPWKNATSLFTPGHVFAPSEPVFQVFDRDFLRVLGAAPRIALVAQNDAFMFAHEAPVWVADSDELFFCSNAGWAPSSLTRTNVLSKISLREAMTKGTATVTEIQPTPTLEMTNGGTWYDGKLLFVNSGRGAEHPPSLALVEPGPPYNSTVILDNYFGMQFNSLNDAKVHPASKAVFVTDPTYGYVVGFRPKPQLPVQVYRFDPRTGEIRVVADGFEKANGPAFSPDGKTAYIADSGAAREGGYDSTKPQTIYAFDVDPDPRVQTFLNRRVFAYVDTGIPDGLVLDTQGNVYAAAGDGVHVFSPRGVLLGKIFVGSTSANIAFAGKGRLVVLAETKIYLVSGLAAEGMNLDFWKESAAAVATGRN